MADAISKGTAAACGFGRSLVPDLELWYSMEFVRLRLFCVV